MAKVFLSKRERRVTNLEQSPRSTQGGPHASLAFRENLHYARLKAFIVAQRAFAEPQLRKVGSNATK